ncbi:MAG: hypothetical protein WCJ56_11985, partial [bacterium]
SKCAFLYVLTGEDTWAQKARKWAEKHINDKFWGTKYLGTEAYFYGKNLAQAYDFCYDAPSWDIAFRSLVSTKLLELGDYIITDGGLNSSDEVVSTMFGIRNAAGGLCYLATDEYYAPIRLDTAYERSSNYLLKNYTADKGARGWNIEGSATNLYAMEHITPFIIAMKRINRKDLTKVSSGTKLTLLTAYLSEIKIGTDKAAYFHPDFNEGNPRLVGEGALGLSFYLVPREYHPGMLYVYDRMVGNKGDKSWDNSRAGSIYSILYHPGLTVLEKEPLKISEWRDAMIEKGGNGNVLFRNSYQGKDDLECQLFFKTRAGVGRSDSMDFRILGKENAWVVGSGGNENERKNTLYLTSPDNVKRINDNNALIIGKPVLNRDGSGNVVSFMVNNNVGVRDHKRRFCANFSDAIKAEGAFVISDTSINGTCWQMNTLDCNKIATDGNAFTITAPNGDVMKGTVLYPEKPIITIGSGTRKSAYTFNGNDCQNKTIQIQSINGSYLVVLTVVKKGTESPKVSADGIWYGRIPGGTVTVGDWKVKIDKDEIIQ